MRVAGVVGRYVEKSIPDGAARPTAGQPRLGPKINETASARVPP